jgi:hypothetical protein
MKKLKKIDLEKRLEMLDKFSTDESKKLMGGYDIPLAGVSSGGGSVGTYVSFSGGSGGGGSVSGGGISGSFYF